MRSIHGNATLLPLALGLVIAVSGCGDNPVVPDGTTLNLSITGLEDLGTAYMYEGWIMVDGSPVSTGIFSVDASGVLSMTDFPVEASDLEAATKFILTIEPSPDASTDPSATHLIAGDFSGNSAALSIADGAALGNDLSTAAGTYILNTPSTAGDDTDWASGIWWLDPTGPSASLTLPVLPDGWLYEGWVVGTGGPVSTGTFATASEVDSDAGGPTAGPDPTPPFPGQDFISPLMPLTGYAAVISIEPDPDNSTAPFTLKPLLDGDIESLGIGVPQAMTNNAAATSPTGTAMR